MHCKTNGISSYCQIADYEILIEFRPDVSTRIKHLERLAPLTEKARYTSINHHIILRFMKAEGKVGCMVFKRHTKRMASKMNNVQPHSTKSNNQ